VISALVRKRAKTFGEDNPEAWAVAATTKDGASILGDRIASELVMDLAWKQALLELLNLAERLEKLLVYLNPLA
jgi:Lon protease-like protein